MTQELRTLITLIPLPEDRILFLVSTWHPNHLYFQFQWIQGPLLNLNYEGTKYAYSAHTYRQVGKKKTHKK